MFSYFALLWIQNNYLSLEAIANLCASASWTFRSLKYRFTLLACLFFCHSYFFPPFASLSALFAATLAATSFFFLSSLSHSNFPSPGCLMVNPIFGSPPLKLTATILAKQSSPLARFLLLAFPERVPV